MRTALWYIALCQLTRAAVLPPATSSTAMKSSLGKVNYFTSDSFPKNRDVNMSAPDHQHDALESPDLSEPVNGRANFLNPLLDSSGCKAYVIIASRGTGESQTDPNGSRNLIKTMFASVPGGEAYEVFYPATFNFLSDPESGATDMMNYMSGLRTRCPNQRLVLFGYSQGAMVTLNCLNSEGMPNVASNIRAVMLTGDPYYRAGQPQNRGTAREGLGIGNVKNIIDQRSMLPPEFVSMTRDFCNEGDPVCQGLSGLSFKDVFTGKGVPAHHYEGTVQESEMIKFGIARLRGLPTIDFD